MDDYYSSHRTQPVKSSYVLVITVGVLCVAAAVISPWDLVISQLLRSVDYIPDRIIDFIYANSGFGKGDVTIFLALLMVVFGWKRRGTEIIIALLITGLLVTPLKIITHRERPRGKSFVSFPSGDAASASAFLTSVAAASPILVPPAVTIMTAVCLGRIASGAHYPSDVLVGTAMGVIGVILGKRFFRRFCQNIRIKTSAELFILALYLSYFAISWMLNEGDVSLRFMLLYGPFIIFAAVARSVFAPEGDSWRRLREKMENHLVPAFVLGVGVIFLLYLFILFHSPPKLKSEKTIKSTSYSLSTGKSA